MSNAPVGRIFGDGGEIFLGSDLKFFSRAEIDMETADCLNAHMQIFPPSAAHGDPVVYLLNEAAGVLDWEYEVLRKSPQMPPGTIF